MSDYPAIKHIRVNTDLLINFQALIIINPIRVFKDIFI